MLGNFPLFLPLHAPSSPASRTSPAPCLPLPLSHKMPRNEMSKKKLATRYQYMKAFFHQKGGLKKYFCRTLCLHLKKLTPIKCDYIHKPCPCHASRNLVLATYILALFRNVTFVSLFAAKWWQISGRQRYHMFSKLQLLQYQSQRWSGGLFLSYR